MQDANQIGVYLLKTPAGKCYVGMTCISFAKRWNEHLKELKSGRHKNPGLKNVYAKYGWDAIEKIILEAWNRPSTIQEIKLLEKHILKRERYWWEQFRTDGVEMLHGCPTGTGSVLHTNQTKERLSIKNSKPLQENTCKNCFEIFWTKKKLQKTCSLSCSAQNRYPKSFLSDDEVCTLYFEKNLSLRQVAEIAMISKDRVHSIVKSKTK